MGTAGTAGAATAMLAATQMPPQERTTFPVSNPASISLQTPEPDGGKVTEQKEKTEKTENKNTQNTETAEATAATTATETKDAELNGSAKAPNKTPIRQTSFEERLDAFVGNLDLSEAQLLACLGCLSQVMHESQGITMNLVNLVACSKNFALKCPEGRAKTLVSWHLCAYSAWVFYAEGMECMECMECMKCILLRIEDVPLSPEDRQL